MLGPILTYFSIFHHYNFTYKVQTNITIWNYNQIHILHNLTT